MHAQQPTKPHYTNEVSLICPQEIEVRKGKIVAPFPWQTHDPSPDTAEKDGQYNLFAAYIGDPRYPDIDISTDDYKENNQEQTAIWHLDVNQKYTFACQYGGVFAVIFQPLKSGAIFCKTEFDVADKKRISNKTECK